MVADEGGDEGGRAEDGEDGGHLLGNFDGTSLMLAHRHIEDRSVDHDDAIRLGCRFQEVLEIREGRMTVSLWPRARDADPGVMGRVG